MLEMASRGGLLRLTTVLLIAALGAACSLEVNDLPENTPPEVGEILMAPPPAELAPLDTFRLSIAAEDLDGDPLTFSWQKNTGDWVGTTSDSSVVWVAPASFAAVDTVRLTAQVRDLIEADWIVRVLEIPVVNRIGDLRVRVFDLTGEPAAVPLLIEGTELAVEATSEHLFEDVEWGDQTVVTLATDAYRGRIDAETGFGGYPRTVFVQPDVENLLDIVVAPQSVLVYPGVDADTVALAGIQAALDLAASAGLDSVLVRGGDYALTPQVLPGGGTAALRVETADLTLAAFPGEGPIVVDAGGMDFGIHLADRGTATRVEGFEVDGATAAGIYLNGSGATLADLIVADCGSAGLFLNGAAGDTLRLDASAFFDNDHALSLSGGVLEGSTLLLARSRWYGLWLRDGAAAELVASTVVDSELAGAFMMDTGAVSFTRCLFADGGRGLFLQSGPEPALDCNLLWGHAYGDYGNVTPGADDLSADPLFCDPAAADWRVEPGSPALDASCGPIGAFGACGTEAAR